MPSTNKFAVLSEVNDKKRQIVVTTDANLPRKQKKTPSQATEAKPEAAKMTTKESHAAAKQAAHVAVKAKANPKAAPTSDAPMSLKEAAAFNKKKAEERAAKQAADAETKAVSDRAATEAAAVKAANEQAQAEVQAAADAAKDAADEAADTKPAAKKVEEAPPKPVMTLADYNTQRAENRFAIGSKQVRSVDKSTVSGLQALTTHTDEIVIPKKAEAPKPAAKPAPKGAKGAAAAAAPAPKTEKKDKAQKIDLTQFADYSNQPRGRGFGGRGRGAERGAGGERGGYRGGEHHHERQPKYEDAASFPSL